MVDAGRTTRGRKVLVFVFVWVFVFGRGKREGGMQMMGDECATGVIVNVRGGPHSKLPRSWCVAASGGVASSLVRHLGEYIYVWKRLHRAMSCVCGWLAAKRWHVVVNKVE